MADAQFRIRDFRLANGMRIIVEEDHATPLVGVFAVVDVGSTDDPQGKEGLAHLLEHLAFRARPGGTASAFRQLEEAGVGTFNAITGFETTTYFELGAKDLLPRLLALDSGRLLDPLVGIDERTFELEKAVVRNELRQRGENAIGPALHALQEAVFPKEHPYSRPVGGTHASLSSITLEDARQFAARHYRPANITLLVLGDLDLPLAHEPLMRGLPASVFQPLRPSKEPFPARLTAQASEPPQPPPEKLLRRRGTVATPELYVVWSLPRAFDTETVLLDFVETAARRELGGAFTSDPNIVDVDVFSVPGLEASMLVARATLRKADRAEASYERLLDQLVKLWASGEAGRQFSRTAASSVVAGERAFGNLRSGAVMEMMLAADDLGSRGLERVGSTHSTGNPLTYGRRLRALGAVTPTQVSTYSEKYLQRGRARAVLVEPFPPEARESTSGPTGLEPGDAEPFALALPPTAIKALGRAASARAEHEARLPSKATHLVESLPNGLKVVVHRREGSLPVAVVRLTFLSGSAGTSPKGAAELATLLAGPRSRVYGGGPEYGIRWRTSVGEDRSTIVGTGASGNLPNMLAQLSERVTSMHAETGTVSFFNLEYADFLERAEQLPVVRAERELNGALFKGHPLGEASLVADQRQVSASQIDDWFERAWSPDRAVLVVVGDVDPETTLSQVRERFGGWKRSSNPFPALTKPTQAAPPPAVLIAHQPNATQARVHLACLADADTAAQALAGRATASLLATTLFEKLRVELGASYGFAGTATPLLGGVLRLDWVGAVDNGRLNDVLTVIHGSITNFEAHALDGRSVERARWQVARELTLEDSTAPATASALSQRTLEGRGEESTDGRFQALAALDPEGLREPWRQCAASLAVSVVGDEAVIREAVQKTGFSARGAARGAAPAAAPDR